MGFLFNNLSPVIDGLKNAYKTGVAKDMRLQLKKLINLLNDCIKILADHHNKWYLLKYKTKRFEKVIKKITLTLCQVKEVEDFLKIIAEKQAEEKVLRKQKDDFEDQQNIKIYKQKVLEAEIYSKIAGLIYMESSLTKQMEQLNLMWANVNNLLENAQKAKPEDDQCFIDMMKAEAQRSAKQSAEIKSDFRAEKKNLIDRFNANNNKIESEKNDALDRMQSEPVNVSETNYEKTSYFWGIYSHRYSYETTKINDNRVKFEHNAQVYQKALEDNQKNKKANDDLVKHNKKLHLETEAETNKAINNVLQSGSNMTKLVRDNCIKFFEEKRKNLIIEKDKKDQEMNKIKVDKKQKEGDLNGVRLVFLDLEAKKKEERDLFMGKINKIGKR